MKLEPLSEEVLAAVAAMLGLIALTSGVYWLFTGLSPWPDIVIAQLVVFGVGPGRADLDVATAAPLTDRVIPHRDQGRADFSQTGGPAQPRRGQK